MQTGNTAIIVAGCIAFILPVYMLLTKRILRWLGCVI